LKKKWKDSVAVVMVEDSVEVDMDIIRLVDYGIDRIRMYMEMDMYIMLCLVHVLLANHGDNVNIEFSIMDVVKKM
jgi:hypothetical protein